MKFHHRTQQGIRCLTDAEASAVRGHDLDSNQRDLLEAIDRGDFPRWKFYVQVMPEADAATLPFNPFNLTKVWPQGDYPLIEVGQWELNRNPENYFAEVEQAAFAPSRVVPGIGFSPDKMLHGRLFSYPDAQYYRLGVNHQTIPVNAPRCPVHSYHRDGAMRVDGNYGTTPALRTQQLRPVAGTARLPHATGTARRRGRLGLELPRGRRRLLHPARRPVREDESRTAPSALRQHRTQHARRAQPDPAALDRPLHQGRPRLRRRCGQSHRRP